MAPSSVLRVRRSAESGPRGASVEAEPSQRDEVVVPGDGLDAARPDERHALVGAPVVSDEIAEADDLVDARAVQRGEHGREGLEVAVDIGDDTVDAHALLATRARTCF